MFSSLLQLLSVRAAVDLSAIDVILQLSIARTEIVISRTPHTSVGEGIVQFRDPLDRISYLP